ncbi:DUF6053 domain-containing protein [Lysobacter enzymogenes]|uniref:DUF6053 domain-containing protein n=1 Tax=Lysobacter enzymogenes TaxID=69 RepID=UPI003D18F8A7
MSGAPVAQAAGFFVGGGGGADVATRAESVGPEGPPTTATRPSHHSRRCGLLLWEGLQTRRFPLRSPRPLHAGFTPAIPVPAIAPPPGPRA